MLGGYLVGKEAQINQSLSPFLESHWRDQRPIGGQNPQGNPCVNLSLNGDATHDLTDMSRTRLHLLLVPTPLSGVFSTAPTLTSDPGAEGEGAWW
jgi:hypothetical protein